MKYSLSILVSALVLAGCITNPSNKQSTAEPTATTATASTAQAAPAGPAAAPATAAADAPCTPAASAKASTTGKTKSAKKTKTSKSKTAAAPATAPCAPSANAANTASAANVAAPVNAAADSKDQPATQGNANRKEVKGINDWSGYIQGTPARNSKFAKLKIGMGEREVIDLIGAPTDQSMHMTGKAWIPFYVGSGKREVWFHYKGVGRLLFADNAGFTTDTGLIGIEHDASERGYK